MIKWGSRRDLIQFMQKIGQTTAIVWRRSQAFVWIFAGITTLVGLVMILFVQTIFWPYNSFIYDSVEKVPSSSIAIVFGAGLNRDGTPTDALIDRVKVGAELYQARKVHALLLTGDGGLHSEVKGMDELALADGVPAKDIVIDYAGIHTYESCNRAAGVFGIHRAIVVSQRYHVPRILYLCSYTGIDSVGVAANLRPYHDSAWWWMREWLARIKAWIDVAWLGRKI